MKTTFKIVKNSFDYYEVRVYIDGIYQPKRTYYADDGSDAIDAMNIMKQEERDRS